MSKNRRNRRGQRGPGEDDDDDEVETTTQLKLANGDGDDGDAGTSLGGGKAKQPKGGKKGRRGQRGPGEDDDDDEEETAPAPKQQQQKGGKKGRRGQRGPGEDDDENDEEETAPASKQQQQKGGKKGRRGQRGPGEDDDDEEETTPAPKQQQQKGGKKGRRGQRGPGEDDEEEEEEEATPAPKQQQKGGKKGRRGQRGPGEDDDEDEEEEAPSKQQKGGKKGRRGQRGPGEDDEEEEEAAPAPKQQQKGGKKNRRDADDDEDVARILQDIADGKEVDEEPPASKQKQQQQKGGKKGRRGAEDDEEVERALQEIAEGKPAAAPSAGTALGGSGQKQQQQKGGKKGKGNRRGAEDDEEVERALQEIAEGKPAAAPSAGTALGGSGQKQQQQKGGKKGRRGAEDDEEVERALQEIAEGKPAAAPSAGTALGGSGQKQQQKGGKKGRRNQAADEDDEVEKVLQSLAEEGSPAQEQPKGGKKGQQQKAAAAEAEAEEEKDEEEGDEGTEGTKQLSAAAKKRLKKKQKEKEKKAQAAAAPPAAAPDTGAKGKAGTQQPASAGAKGKAAAEVPAAAPKKPGARNAIAAMILKQQEAERKRQEEEERRIKEEEERLLKEAQVEAAKRREIDAQRAVRREKKKDKLKRAAENKAERERQERLARLGITIPAGTDGEAGAPKQKKPQSALYAKPKKQKQINKSTGESEQSPSQVAKTPEHQPAPSAESKAEEPDSWEEVDEWEKQAEEPKPETDTAAEGAVTTTVASSESPVPSAEAEQKEPPTDKTENTEAECPEQKAPDLRSPICCILGHVDTGKTKLLDKIRQTNVQGGEAGGITQQIGASFFPLPALKEKTKVLAERLKFEIKVPGLLVIDTPGHESFTNLRSRGSSLCDIAVLVVDLMHGLEPQTLESLKLLRQRKTPFIVALNKIDRIFGWKATPDAPFRQTLNKQAPSAKQEFETRLRHTVTMFAEQGLNAVLYYQNKDIMHNVSLVPTSAHTGEGIPDLLAVLIQLTQTKLTKKIITKENFQATVLEVKVVEGLGTTIDVILVNGVLHEGDRIVVCGLDGPIATNIRALLTPHPLRELRVKTPYIHHKEVVAAQGVKIAAHGLDRAVAGSSILVVGDKDDEEELMSHVQGDLTDILKKVQKRGVSVQASTLGSLEALLRFLEDCDIPVGAINIGPVHRSDVIKASVNLDKGKRKEYGCILAFDVPVDRDAKAEAAKNGVKIFTADIIYHLFDQFTKFLDELKAAEKAEAALKVVFPCTLEILPDCIFNKKEPIIVGVRVVDGLLKMGTPLCVQKTVTVTDDEGRTRTRREMLYIGKITSLQDNHKEVPQATIDQQVAIKIEGTSVTFGRQFDETYKIYSQLSRESIDALKDHFREVLVANKGMVQLIQKLKPMFDIM